jgi:methionyl-tRNA synthetase
VVRIETILDAFGDEVYGKQFSDSTKADRDLFASDVMRYFLLREVPFGQDGNFSLDAMVTRYNADLANGYGNLVSRTLKMISDYFSGSIPEGIPFAQSMDTVKAVMALVAAIGDVAATGFAEQLTTTAMVVTTTDGFLTATTPWKLAKVPDQ